MLDDVDVDVVGSRLVGVFEFDVTKVGLVGLDGPEVEDDGPVEAVVECFT